MHACRKDTNELNQRNWLGEPSFGPLTQRFVAAFEGGLFGFGLAWGLTRRVGWPANSGPVS